MKSPAFVWAARTLALVVGVALGFAISAPREALAQFVSSGGGASGATVDVLAALVGKQVVANDYRATTATGPGFTCDGTLTACVDFGPGGGANNCNAIGTNAGGDLLVGNANTGCIARFGQVFGSQIGTTNTALVGNQLIQAGGGAGIMDFTGSGGFRINNTTPIKGVVRATVNADFPSIANGSCSVMSVSVTGATLGDAVSANADFALPADIGIGNARVTSANTVDLRLCNHNAALAQDPAAGNFILRLER